MAGSKEATEGTGLAAGEMVLDRYRLAHPIGSGGMGAVWEAEHLALRSRIALKFLDARFAHDAAITQRFHREAQAAATLRSAHVVQVMDHGVYRGRPFIAMELLDGENLAQRLEREGRLTPIETLRIVTHVCRAAARAHAAGIIHRDLKPANIFLVRNDDELVAKVLDFGIAKLLDPTDVSSTQSGIVIGTALYMSPEQARGSRDVDGRADIWAIAVIAFECILGRLPFTGTSLGEVILSICADPLPIPSSLGSVPAGFDAWFARGTSRPVDGRFASARDLADGLRAVVLGLSAPSLPEVRHPDEGLPARAESSEDEIPRTTVAAPLPDTEPLYMSPPPGFGPARPLVGLSPPLGSAPPGLAARFALPPASGREPERGASYSLAATPAGASTSPVAAAVGASTPSYADTDASRNNNDARSSSLRARRLVRVAASLALLGSVVAVSFAVLRRGSSGAEPGPLPVTAVTSSVTVVTPSGSAVTVLRPLTLASSTVEVAKAGSPPVAPSAVLSARPSAAPDALVVAASVRRPLRPPARPVDGRSGFDGGARPSAPAAPRGAPARDDDFDPLAGRQ